MQRLLKAFVLFAALAGLAVAGVSLAAWRPAIEPLPSDARPASDPALIARGAQLAAVGNCIACHTVPGGKSFAGGLPIPTPFGTIHSTNITPDAQTGIGRWSEAAFIRSMRDGVDREGNHLYPAFPYDHFTLVTDDDNRALYAYLMSRTAVAGEPPENDLPFPLRWRPLLAGWKLLFFEAGAYVPDASRSAEWNRGRYLADGLGHCGACHSPRNALGAEQRDRYWAGGMSEGWSAYPIDASSPAPIPWEAEALAFYLKEGWHEAHGVSRGPMAEVTGNLAGLPDADIRAIAAYTVSVMGEATPERQARAAELRPLVLTARGVGQTSDTQTAPLVAGPRAALPSDTVVRRGADIYAAACASCHDSDRPQPYGGLSFLLSTAVNAPDPQNIINVALFGLPPADGEASAVMPAYAGVLTDDDTVALLRFLRDHYSDLPPWEGLARKVTDTRSGAFPVTVRPTDGIERAPGNIGAED